MKGKRVPGAAAGELPKSLFGYEVIDYLGEGAGSVLYAVDEPATRQLCALKLVILQTDRDDRYLEQLENEYAVGRQMVHPTLRRCYQLKVQRTWLHKISEAALLMELVDGMPLDYLERAEPEVMIRLFAKTATGLQSLHARGIVHCDIKPNNILTDGKGLIKIIDFGQACPINTVKKRVQGTADYIAPEQYRCQAVTPQTDVFNLGATMYWWLCRHRLPTVCTAKRSGHHFLTGDDTPAPHQLNPEVPATLSNLVMECVRDQPLKRPSSMSEIVYRLEAVHYGLTHHHAAVPPRSAGHGGAIAWPA